MLRVRPESTQIAAKESTDPNIINVAFQSGADTPNFESYVLCVSRSIFARTTYFFFFFFPFFFGAGGWRSAPKRPRMPGRKGNTEKEGGQAAAKKRSPLLRMWKRAKFSRKLLIFQTDFC